MSPATTPWQRGRLDGRHGAPRLLFGQMYEDWTIEAEVFPPAGRVFCIASAGSTSMALASRGLTVTAVDINPAQVAYVRDRLQGAPPRAGTADWFFAAGRHALPLMGLRRSVVRQFLELVDPTAQVRFWRAHLDTARFKAALAVAISPAALRTIYSSTFVRVLPRRFDRIIRARLERCWARHPNRTNPYAWRFFLGTDPPDQSAPTPAPQRIELACADAAAYLESCPPAHFIGFSLSNILDGTEPAYAERLMAAVRRSAQDRAAVVLRSFMEPPPGESTEWPARDRSMLWGRLRVEKVRG
jgi:S-adenosylmethionine:diacylglycerol 3-amino-3-carboxypropyl transferase